MNDRSIDGLVVAVRGAGRPMVLLHGNGESRQIFDPLLPQLRGNRTLILPDTRGHGRSARGDGPLSMRRLAADVARVIGEVADEPVDLVGFSDGGNIGLTLAGVRPDLLRSLVVIGANTQPCGLRAGTLLAVATEYGALRVASLASSHAAARAEVIGLMVREPHLTAADLHRIQAPTLVLVGDRDVVTREDTKRIVDHVPRAQLAVVVGCGHNAITVKPGVVAAAIDEFLADVDELGPINS